MRYDPILCMMVDDSVKTIDSSEYDKWLKQNETEASNENLVKYLMEVKGFTKENAMKYAKGKTHDSLDKAIRSCDAFIEFPSEKEAIEYCKENSIDPHKIILAGDKYIIKK